MEIIGGGLCCLLFLWSIFVLSAAAFGAIDQTRWDSVFGGLGCGSFVAMIAVVFIGFCSGVMEMESEWGFGPALIVFFLLFFFGAYLLSTGYCTWFFLKTLLVEAEENRKKGEEDRLHGSHRKADRPTAGPQPTSHGRTVVENDHGKVCIDTSAGRLTVIGPGGGFALSYQKLKGDPAATISILMRFWHHKCQGEFPFQGRDLERIQNAVDEG